MKRWHVLLFTKTIHYNQLISLTNSSKAAISFRNGPLTRYSKLRFGHAPGMPGTFYPRPTLKETASQRSQHASRHVRQARAMMHVGIVNPRWRENNLGIPGACATRNFIRGSLQNCDEMWLCTCNAWTQITTQRHFGYQSRQFGVWGQKFTLISHIFYTMVTL